MRISTRTWGFGALLALGTMVALLVAFAPAAAGGASHARWDIITVDNPAATTTVNPGGVASAKAPDNTKIKLTGSGTFVDPSGNGGGSNAVTGGGTWETFNAAGASTGSGTYAAKELVDFEFANFQSPGLIDNIGDTTERANGNAVLRIAYSDGSHGVLWIGCHGGGAPDGIFEGIAATKGFKTYNAVQSPSSTLNENRTIFHVRQ